MMLMTSGRLAPGTQRLVWGIVAGIGLMLALRSVQLAYNLSRPIPYWDQWEFFKRAPDVLAGRFGFADLISQHNEHRIATSRVVFILDLMFFDGSSFLCIVVLYATLALIAAVMAGCWDRWSSRAAAFCMFLGLLLSPAQWENLTSGFQVQFPFVDLFAFGSLACIIKAIDHPDDRGSAWALAAAGSLLDLLAVFSMASGLLAVIPSIWAGVVLQTRSRPFFAYVACHCVYCGLFLFHYVRPTGVAVAADPILVARFIVVYMGASLRGYAHGPFLLGSLDALCLASAACWMLWRSFREKTSVDRVQVFAMGVALLMVANAAVTATGRASLGIEAAVSSRYSLQSIVLQIALFVLLWRIWADRPILRIPPLVGRLGLLVGFLCLSMSSNLSPSSRDEWENHVAALDKAGFALTNAVFADNRLSLVYPWPKMIKEAAAVLASRKLGPFSPRFGGAYRAPQNIVAGLSLDDADDCRVAASIKRSGPHWFDVEGWAYDPRSPSGNGWVLVLDRSDHDRMVGFGRQSLSRPDVDEVMKVAIDRSGFDVALNTPELDEGQPQDLALVVVPEDASRPSCRAAIPAPAEE